MSSHMCYSLDILFYKSNNMQKKSINKGVRPFFYLCFLYCFRCSKGVTRDINKVCIVAGFFQNTCKFCLCVCVWTHYVWVDTTCWKVDHFPLVLHGYCKLRDECIVHIQCLCFIWIRNWHNYLSWTLGTINRGVF